MRSNIFSPQIVSLRINSPVKGFIFDLDGTLADTKLDFAKMCIDAGLPVGTKILEHCASLNDTGQVEQILSVVEQHELDGANQASWILDAEIVLNKFKQANIPMAIVTRNMREAALMTIERLGIPIDLVITRDECLPKPDPDGLLMVSKQWNILPNELVYVGDYQFDLVAAKQAQMMACLIANQTNQHLFEMADKVITTFDELNELL
ncbi:MAG: phosphoglycolate phosphatase-like HAD superfamily hydrolase [Polaribacter sp.]|jgi:phosphoglycolate phosphatase-like HAD superfamily hydrolase